MVTARELARARADVWIACRSEARARTALEQIHATAPGRRVELLTLDLASLESVRRAAETFLRAGQPLHVLVNNAGLAGMRGLTRDVFELAFGVNHLGHFLLTMLLLERIEASAPARIVNVSSQAHYRARGIDFDAVRRKTASFTGMPEYGVAKLAEWRYAGAIEDRILHAEERARLFADDDPSNDPELFIHSGNVCVACHAD